MTAPFAPTHSAPAGGLDTRPAPDISQAANSHLDAGLEVQVRQWHGDWAEIVCANGWAAWVDGRVLVARPASQPVVQVPPAQPAQQYQQPAPVPTPTPTPTQAAPQYQQPAAAQPAQQYQQPASAQPAQQYQQPAAAPPPPQQYQQPAPQPQYQQPAPQYAQPQAAPGQPGYYASMHQQAYAPPVAGTPAQIAMNAVTSAPAKPFSWAPAIIGAIIGGVSGFLPWFGAMGVNTTGFEIPIQFLIKYDVEPTGGITVGLLVAAFAVAAAACSASPALDKFRRGAGWLMVLLPTICVGQLQRSISASTAGARPGSISDTPSLFSLLGFGLGLAIIGGLLTALSPGKK